MRVNIFACVVLGGAASINALWFPILGRRDETTSVVTVTETLRVHDSCTSSQVSANNGGGGGGSGNGGPTTTLTTITATSTVFATQTTTVTLDTPPTSTVTLTSTLTNTLTAGVSAGEQSQGSSEGPYPSSGQSLASASSSDTTSYSIVFSTLTVLPLSTPPPTHAHTSTTEVTTIYATRTTTDRITVPGPATSLTSASNTAPYGNGTTPLASTSGTGSLVGTSSYISLSPSSSVSQAANTSSTCTESLSAGPITMGSSTSAPMNSSAGASTTSMSVSSFVMPSAASDTLTLSANSSTTLMKRQIGAPVTATINGQTVTFANAFSPTTSIAWTPVPNSLSSPGTSSAGSVSKSSSEASAETSIKSSYSRGPLPTSSLATPKTSASTSLVTLSPFPTSSKSLASTNTSVPTSSLRSAGTLTSVATRSITTSLSPSATCTGRNAGQFKIGFDDLPQVAAQNNTKNYAPFDSPYHNLYWANGFSYVPLPNDPYKPWSPPHLGIFIVDPNSNIHTDNVTEVGDDVPSGDEINGMFGAGPNFRDSAFWFGANSAHFGCQNTGPELCVIQVTGFKYEPIKDVSKVEVREHYRVHPCNQTSSCTLMQVGFGIEFANLTAIQINAYKNYTDGTQTPVNWFVDELVLDWSNNSCAAVAERSRLP